MIIGKKSGPVEFTRQAQQNEVTKHLQHKAQKQCFVK
jgi:hypothetical protein